MQPYPRHWIFYTPPDPTPYDFGARLGLRPIIIFWGRLFLAIIFVHHTPLGAHIRHAPLPEDIGFSIRPLIPPRMILGLG